MWISEGGNGYGSNSRCQFHPESPNIEGVLEKTRGSFGEEHGTEWVGGSSSQDASGVLESAGLRILEVKGRDLGNGEGSEYGLRRVLLLV